MHDNSTSNPEVDTDTASEVEQPDAVIGQNDEIVILSLSEDHKVLAILLHT